MTPEPDDHPELIAAELTAVIQELLESKRSLRRVPVANVGELFAALQDIDPAMPVCLVNEEDLVIDICDVCIFFTDDPNK